MLGALLCVPGALVGTRTSAVIRPSARTRTGPPFAQVAAPAATYALHDAAADGDANAVDLLLFAGFPAEERNAKDSTPLHIAAMKGHDAVAKILLDHGASPDAANEDGNTPLHAAVASRQLEVAQLLLARGATAEAASRKGLSPLRIAAQQGNAQMLGALIDAGARMDEETAQAAFWAAVKISDSTPETAALPADVPRLLHRIFDADMHNLLNRDKIAQNRTCMQPAESGGVAGVAASLTYIFDYDAHADLPLKEGRRCDGGECCAECSRVQFPTFATGVETDKGVFPALDDFCFNECSAHSTATKLCFVRLLERIRRTIAHEYGLPLSTVLPLQAYSRTAKAGTSSEGGGGNLGGDGLPLHTDEATHASYHYSCVLYLSSQGEDFEGGAFVWNDPSVEEQGDAEGDGGPVDGGAQLSKVGRTITPYKPTRGSAIIFSSGWENMHAVRSF